MTSQDVRPPLTSDAAVRGATGHDYDAWFALLDAWGASGRTHGEIAAWLIGERGTDTWWAQTITVQYERARGLRPPGAAATARCWSAERQPAAHAPSSQLLVLNPDLTSAPEQPSRRTRTAPWRRRQPPSTRPIR